MDMKFIPYDTYKVYMRKMDALNTVENKHKLAYEDRKLMVTTEMREELYNATVEALLDMCDRSVRMEKGFSVGEEVYKSLKETLINKLK